MTVAELVEPRRLVVERRPVDDRAWRDFVADRPDRLPFHDRAWVDVLTDAYGYKSFAAVVTDADGRITAGVPVVEVRRPLGPRRWLVLPFTDYCPPLAEDAESSRTLVIGLEALREQSGAASVEFRSDVTPASYAIGVRHLLALDRDPDVVFAAFKKKQVRQLITKAVRDGIVKTRISRERLDFEAFLRLHLATRRRLGVPVQPPGFLERFWEQLIVGGPGFIVIAEVDAHPVSAAVFLTAGSTVVYKFSASDATSWRLRPNNLVLWTAIQHACVNGYEWFDFGRTESAHEGLRVFKAGWGAEEIPLRYSVLGREVPETSTTTGRSVTGTIIRRSPPVVCRLAGRALYRYAA